MVDCFIGENRWLSNFWPAKVLLDGVEYKTVEHAYQAAKTLDSVERELIARCQRPGSAKRLGYLVTMREDWEQVKLSVMKDLVKQKFQEPELKAKLLKTGKEELVEGNTWKDTFWGVCDGVGENHLGKIIMEVRLELTFALLAEHLAIELKNEQQV